MAEKFFKSASIYLTTNLNENHLVQNASKMKLLVTGRSLECSDCPVKSMD